MCHPKEKESYLLSFLHKDVLVIKQRFTGSIQLTQRWPLAHKM